VWQRRYLTGEILERQLAFWLEHLAGAPPLLELATDRPRRKLRSYAGAAQRFQLGSAFTQKLEDFCRESEVTTFMLLQAGLVMLLHRFSGQDHIVVGTPIANRNRIETEGLIGLFVNTLVLHHDLSGNPRFEHFLENVRRITIDAYAHQDLPFEKLVEVLNPKRSPSYNPVFQVQFVYENKTGVASEEMAGLHMEPFGQQVVSAKFDLTLTMSETPHGLVGILTYSTDLFDETTIQRFTEQFQAILDMAVDQPDLTVAALAAAGETPSGHQADVLMNDFMDDLEEEL